MAFAKSSAGQYSPVSVSIHWPTAIFVITTLYLGFVADGIDPGAAKIVLLRFHAIAGIYVSGDEEAKRLSQKDVVSILQRQIIWMLIIGSQNSKRKLDD